MTEEELRAALPPAQLDRAHEVARRFGVALVGCYRAEYEATQSAAATVEQTYRDQAIRLGVDPTTYTALRKAER